MPSAKYRNLRENTGDPWTHDNLTRNKVTLNCTKGKFLIHKTSTDSALWHFILLQSWERTSTHTFLRGVKSGISFMKGDTEIINRMRDAFCMGLATLCMGLCPIKTYAQEWNDLRIVSFPTGCCFSLFGHLLSVCYVSKIIPLWNVYFHFPFWCQKEGKGPWGNSSHYDVSLPFKRFLPQWKGVQMATVIIPLSGTNWGNKNGTEMSKRDK